MNQKYWNSKYSDSHCFLIDCCFKVCSNGLKLRKNRKLLKIYLPVSRTLAIPIPQYPGHQHLHFTGVLDKGNLHFIGIPDTGNFQITGVWDTVNCYSRCPGHREFDHNCKAHELPVSHTSKIRDSPVSQTPGKL